MIIPFRVLERTLFEMEARSTASSSCGMGWEKTDGSFRSTASDLTADIDHRFRADHRPAHAAFPPIGLFSRLFLSDVARFHDQDYPCDRRARI